MIHYIAKYRVYVAQISCVTGFAHVTFFFWQWAYHFLRCTWLIQVLAQVARKIGMAQLPQRLLLQLANSFAGETKHLAHFL